MPNLSADDSPCTCDKCERVFSSYVYRVVTIGNEQARELIDRDGDVVYDLVKVCKCGHVFHWHTKEQTMRKHAMLYSSAFEKLMSHYPKARAIIDAKENK